jgi:hypothetical protein
MPEILNLLAPLLLGNINRQNLPKRVRPKTRATLLLIKKKKTVPKVGTVGLVWYWDSHELLMFPLLMAGHIMYPSGGVLTVCMSKHLQKWFLNCCYKVNMILKVTKKPRYLF